MSPLKGQLAGAEQGPLSSAESLRVKMWQARSRNSRSTGIILLIFSAAFLAASFLSAYSPFEIVAIISFVFGVFLISSGLEAKVKLIPSAESVLGPMLAIAGDLAKRGFNGKAEYVPVDGGETVMQVGREPSSGETETLVPVGRGLAASYERELGPLKDVDPEYIRTWLPRLMVKGLALAEVAKIAVSDGTTKLSLRRSVMRPLCVREDFNEKVCRKIGCPLVSSVGETMASSTRKEVTFHGCEYDRLKEVSTAKYVINHE
jgi:hypothetical protein